MLCIKVRKHSLKRALVAEVALAQEADKAYSRRDGYRASVILSVTKHSHRSVVVQPSTVGWPGVRVVVPNRVNAESLQPRPGRPEQPLTLEVDWISNPVTLLDTRPAVAWS